MKNYSVASVFAASIIAVIMIVGVAVTSSGLSPWELFQSMCPYLGIQSPQCLTLPYQQQQPYQQLCPNGSAPDINGNCQIIQQQQSQ